ncbi:uncharacterized protein LOC118701553 [Molothrus ater]|uniref:uncharacterized protein LOC118701553 n=1 Tax=Molothrus ater TaxID=84834 RepID=UPI00174C3D3B|nr:uncharacterized protein LOC118701553 [Molothrus ater]
MGLKLSTAQTGVYYHSVGILVSANVKFSKGKLKQFTRWLFLHFPQTSPEEVHNIQFWDKVGHELITLGQSGNTSSAKFVFWSLQIQTALLKQRELEKKPNIKPCTSVLPVSPPSSPKPLTPKLGILKRANPAHVLGSRLPELVKMPEFPCPQGPGQTAWNIFQNPVSPALKPRARVSFSESSDAQNGPQSLGGTQDGGCHVAPLKTWSSSSQDPLKHPKIPFPSPSPPVPRDAFPPPPFPAVPSAPPLYSSQGASADVTSPGVPAPCLPPVSAPCSHCVPAPSPGSHGGGTPTACPQTCICYLNASNSKDTGQEAADPIQGPTLSFAPLSYQPAAQGGAAPTANWSSFGRQLIKESVTGKCL